jgi:putative addiction module component (TIGR02574 family)
MSPNLTNALAAAELLSVEERRELIDLLLEKLDESANSENGGPPPTLSEAWKQEVKRRSAEYDAGKAETVPWEEVRGYQPE